jgi:hypothetical protein
VLVNKLSRKVLREEICRVLGSRDLVELEISSAQSFVHPHLADGQVPDSTEYRSSCRFPRLLMSPCDAKDASKALNAEGLGGPLHDAAQLGFT